MAALKGGEVDVGLLFTTDPSISFNDFVLLVDNRHLQPAENVVPVMRQEAIDKHGERAVDVIDSVTARLTTDVLRGLNERVGIRGQKAATVATHWLNAQGLI